MLLQKLLEMLSSSRDDVLVFDEAVRVEVGRKPELSKSWLGFGGHDAHHKQVSDSSDIVAASEDAREAHRNISAIRK